MDKHRILILGGTTEARALAARLAGDDRFDTTLSLAGRTLDPRPQPVPVRVGGFGGAEGLARHLAEEAVDLMIDATHPFAARISRNAAEAAQTAGVPLVALRRPAWERQAGDLWESVGSIPEAVRALPQAPSRVFLAIGRQEASQFSARPEHSYLVRSVDPVTPPLDVPDARYLLACGPFGLEDELDLLKRERIDVIVAKNSGGSATYAKIEAARLLGIRVIMVERQEPPGVPAVPTVEAALAHIDHLFSADRKRGV
ncbi:cobalt-precorrin-6A reductase [Gellertiella hungarica]|uniref:Precorrin-6A/cobalt-precorrin-6A reductase n=1 Tax=Gellertiella hungarica TaxID=1572859 RepID=A0A7W6J1I6_9HYPH|nr:cobalt-precorrin-6A reductase [Gellertiella hungarica]MBB4063058.1 precorrin-6A/cobalt-precorrin-6A reductase [Gellertiella hungarica]